MTSFVGRRREIDETRARLQQSRLVSVLGSGGVGKTRLAEEIALRSSRAFRDSVRWIDLALVREPETLPSAAAQALGVTDQSARPAMSKILDHVERRHMLIVVDNCEHLNIAAAEFIAAILAHAPEVRVLTTSREPLGIAGECTYVLPPLGMPKDSTGNKAANLALVESVALLVERTQSVVQEFELTDANVDAVAQLCIQLDGIPLAIELAATRLRSLSPAELVQRLDQRFTLLTSGSRTASPRQQTLRALIDWSYALCSEGERALWARLSVFPGSFDLEAAETVCGSGDLASEPIVNLLDGLISKSLVSVDRSRERLRYSQLMTVREYGHGLLEARGECEELHCRHRDHFLERAQRYAGEWYGSGQSELLAQWRIDHANLMTALDWSLQNDELRAAAALAVSLRYHWTAGGNLSDGRTRLERLLQRLPHSTSERGHVLWLTACIALIQGDHDGASTHLAECASLASTLEEQGLQAHYDHWAGLQALLSGRTAEAIDRYRRAIRVHRSLGAEAEALTASYLLALAEIYDGRPEDALATCAEVIRETQLHGERWNRAYALFASAVANFHLGKIDAAVDAAERVLEIQRDFEDAMCTALTLEVLAWCSEAVGDLERSVNVFSAATSVWQQFGTSLAAFGPDITRDSTEAQERVNRSIDCAKSPASSMPLTIAQAIDLALGQSAARTTKIVTGSSPLTRREQEIAELIAQGLTNREMAAQLIISRRTVDGHVERILNKLGLNSRTQISAWVHAAQQALVDQ
ncbi:LuxR C-terminal-related transcriptional regulator [Nocardia pseudovaccinii]|uniref:LuxR C-terminal-related transcriptional regulator n=1 Tax=Nocardia pseudovaccinii TaxID=189540 RepID=UPI0007A51E7D|nr:LuxR C-terminal-related transcriptional regulator [Nocardia pseudovaccinii]